MYDAEKDLKEDTQREIDRNWHGVAKQLYIRDLYNYLAWNNKCYNLYHKRRHSQDFIESFFRNIYLIPL